MMFLSAVPLVIVIMSQTRSSSVPTPATRSAPSRSGNRRESAAAIEDTNIHRSRATECTYMKPNRMTRMFNSLCDGTRRHRARAYLKLDDDFEMDESPLLKLA
ncbi:hypothetical protein BX616_005073 [Lobosporangium transversale]|uniref:Secreted protein n=1 Tax=Lobosporangium transversale TaxID=64571 RepID=A0A1Y2GQW1_9FUNG|nr:hypothetical protein BCR41DRAFT_395376 [Lobosporangium transversale]KAF9897736.1 hypothetical protein BX616_005073 [Lobosporangium transversale]ORZ19244.1 hypothetical protein BCR41DRAFT_395376 [Lobosporangium transversale]|eukprot:XP_021882412.1 hypothetical protein BCR41DRAFT_395376 [Lobosporangium transversale]